MLDDPDEVRRRRARMTEPHMAALARALAVLRGMALPGDELPDPDPCDGGAGARLLLLLEKPGPAASRGRGSGFVSFDNRSPTGAAGRAFAAEAGIDRRRAIVWNAVPWWNGTIRLTAAERARGLAALPVMLDALPHLRASVCVGRAAGAARPALEARGLAVSASAHPSPQVRAAFPERWRAIGGVWREAALAAGACGDYPSRAAGV